MPLKDSYSVEKELLEEATEILDAVVSHYGPKNAKRGIAVFIVDYDTGTMADITTINRQDLVAGMKAWSLRNTQ